VQKFKNISKNNFSFIMEFGLANFKYPKKSIFHNVPPPFVQKSTKLNFNNIKIVEAIFNNQISINFIKYF